MSSRKHRAIARRECEVSQGLQPLCRCAEHGPRIANPGKRLRAYRLFADDRIQILSALYGTIPEPDSTGGDEDETPRPFGAVGFPTLAGTSPEGHEEACTTIDRVHEPEQRPTAPRGRHLESGAKCCTPEVGSYIRMRTNNVTSLTEACIVTFYR